MTSMEVRSNPHCLVCNSRVGVSTRNSQPIFNQQVQTCSERPLSTIMSAVLGKELSETNVHSLLICKKCFKLFDEVDELESRLAEVKVELVGNYKRSMMKYEPANEEDDKQTIEQLDTAMTSLKSFSSHPESGVKTEVHIITIPTSDDDNEDARADIVLENIAIKLQEIHGGGNTAKASEVDNQLLKEELAKEDNIADEPMDAGALDNPDDSDYEPPADVEEVIVEDVEKEDNTAALLEAAALAEQNLENENGAIKAIEKLQQSSAAPNRTTKHTKAKEVKLDPIVTRNGDLYTCLSCNSGDPFVGVAKTMMLHVKTIHDLRVYICDVCGQHFRKRNELSVHLDEHVATEEGDFQCEVCNRIFSNLRLFRIHKRMHYPQAKAWSCETCGKRYSSRNLLEEHTNTHTGARPYQCNVCNKDFASKYTFRAHERTHEIRPRPYQCQHCTKSFLSQQNLTQHEKTHSGIKDYVCHLCGKAFGSPHNLEVHSIVHTGYKPFICGICGKAFARKAEIRDHERTHTGERPYQCEMCGATFSQRSNLQSHKRATHYDDKRYKCSSCGKAFKRRRLLDYHMKAAHTGERPFKCSVCDATFVYPEHFKKHRRIHTGEKPFLCEVCGKAFNSRDNRNAHRFVHSNKKPYECLVCGAGFMRKPLLYAHMQAQGHLNDTIVVNQPHLATEDDQIVTLNADGEVEILEDEDVHQLETIEEIEGDNPEDTKLYIAELKEHVIIQGSELYGSSKGTVIVGTDDTGVEETVEHLIIGGQQVNFIQQEDDDDNDEDVSQQIITEEEYEDVITDGLVETENGTVLVQIRIPAENGEGEENAWVKIAE